MTFKVACVIASFLLLHIHQASALDVEKVREAVETIGVLLHKTMRTTSLFRIPRESRDESERNGDHSPDYDKIHYSLGPIGACSRPEIAHCSFSSSITIPEYYARLYHQSASPQMTKLYNEFRLNVDSKCAEGIMSIICPYAVIPQCQSDAQVKFVVPDFETVCVEGVSKCPNSDALESVMCSSDGDVAKAIQGVVKHAENLKGKSFELTKCRFPSISACDDLLPSPDWLAAEREEYFDDPLLDSTLDSLSEECKNKVSQFLCAFPTCNANQTTVIGHRNQASCNDAFSCVPSNLRNQILKIVPCSDFSGLDKPSPNYNRGPPKSLAWWECLCIAVGCALGVVLLVGTIVSVRKRTRRRRLEIYQKMETSTT